MLAINPEASIDDMIILHHQNIQLRITPISKCRDITSFIVGNKLFNSIEEHEQCIRFQ